MKAVPANKIATVLLVTEDKNSLSAKNAVAKWEAEHKEQEVFCVSRVTRSGRQLHIELMVVPKGAIRAVA